MLDLWRRHIAWRFMSAPASTLLPSGGKQATTNGGRPCTKCRKPVEDARYKHCAACRASSTKAAKKRARKRKLNGLCPKCGGPRGVETVVCSACLAKGRATYHNRKG